MIELRFHEELYDGFAVDEAAKVYGPFANLELMREPDGYVVRLTASEAAAQQGIDERTLAAELANYALGLTIEKQSAAEPEEAERSSDSEDRGVSGGKRPLTVPEGGAR